MKRLLAAAMILLPAAAGAATLELLRADSGVLFAQAPALMRGALRESAIREGALGPLLQTLEPRAASNSARLGAELGRVDLASQLDRNLNVMRATLGARPRNIGVATDGAHKKYFMTFDDGGAITLSDLGSDYNRVINEGVDVRVDASTVYNVRVQPNMFDPVRGSTFFMTPTAGTAGPSYSDKTGLIVDAARARATVIVIQGSEYWFAYGRDALADGSGFAATRSFLIIHEAGLSSKAFALAEDSLKPDAPSIVDLKGVRVELTRTSAGQLIVRSAD
jgi:hypothetical protein